MRHRPPHGSPSDAPQSSLGLRLLLVARDIYFVSRIAVDRRRGLNAVVNFGQFEAACTSQQVAQGNFPLRFSIFVLHFDISWRSNCIETKSPSPPSDPTQELLVSTERLFQGSGHAVPTSDIG
jgi:hypothetical protein